jgi:hypothetical protein
MGNSMCLGSWELDPAVPPGLEIFWCCEPSAGVPG